MTNIRMKIAVAATIFGLGGLGGFAISANPARNAPTQIAAPLASTANPASAKGGLRPAAAAGDHAHQRRGRTHHRARHLRPPAAGEIEPDRDRARVSPLSRR